MAEYLSKETLQEKLNRKKAGPANKRYTEGWNDAVLMVKSMIHSEKVADVAQVRHGRWVHVHQAIVDTTGDCSACHKEAVWRTRNNPYGICPNCGAKMDLE